MTVRLADAAQSLFRYATATPRRATAVRYAGSIGLIAALFAVIPQTPLDGPVGGVFALTCVVICCWFAGLGPALCMPLAIWLVSRGLYGDPQQPLLPSARELMTFVGLTMLTGAIGLAGDARRRLHAATIRHDARMREQSRALNMAQIIFRDLDGRIAGWSEGAARLYGWTAEEAVGQEINELLRTRFPVPPREVREMLLSQGQWQGELVQVHRDGRELTVTVHCIRYASHDGAAESVAEVHTDVTDLRRAEAEIRQADRRKDLFVATLAHELRNPLAPLRTGLDLLRMTSDLQPDDGEVIEVMQRQLEHVVRMVDDLLDVSRFNTGKVKLRRTRVVLADIVRDAVATCRPQIDAARHTLQVALPAESICLVADAARLTQVLINLLSNAAKFTPPGGTIQLSARCDGDTAVIQVRDNGAGIPPQALPQIFDMFAQVEHPQQRAAGGLGLGLSIVRSLVELHGGTVQVHSDGPGQGAEFAVRLPVSNQEARLQEPPESSIGTNGPQPSVRVLVVDDNRDAAQTLTLMLKKLGFDSQARFDGESALQAAGQLRPHAVVLDLGIPGMDGFEVARRLRARPEVGDALLIALTGWDKDEDRLRSRAAGFDHHLAKPVDPGSLQRLLREAGAPRDAEIEGAQHRLVAESVVSDPVPVNSAASATQR